MGFDLNTIESKQIDLSVWQGFLIKWKIHAGCCCLGVHKGIAPFQTAAQPSQSSRKVTAGRVQRSQFDLNTFESKQIDQRSQFDLNTLESKQIDLSVWQSFLEKMKHQSRWMLKFWMFATALHRFKKLLNHRNHHAK